LTAQPSGIPATLEHYVKHTHSLLERVVLVQVVFERVPRVPVRRSVTVEELGHGMWRAAVHVGFMERPSVTDRLRDCPASAALGLDAADVTFFLGHETFLATPRGEMGRASELLFAFLYKNAGSTTTFLELPPDRVMEIGMQIDL
jgi:KUP system potassium uptake protein